MKTTLQFTWIILTVYLKHTWINEKGCWTYVRTDGVHGSLLLQLSQLRMTSCIIILGNIYCKPNLCPSVSNILFINKYMYPHNSFHYTQSRLRSKKKCRFSFPPKQPLFFSWNTVTDSGLPIAIYIYIHFTLNNKYEICLMSITNNYIIDLICNFCKI